MIDLADRTREYFAALTRGVIGDELKAFYAEDVTQEEFPNRLVPGGARRNLEDILLAAARGRMVMSDQSYDLISLMVDGDSVAVEFYWSGIAKIDLGTLPAGGVMRGRFASFIDYRDGLIASQRSYDCFDAW